MKKKLYPKPWKIMDEVVGDKMLERFDNLNWILQKDYDKSNIYHIR